MPRDGMVRGRFRDVTLGKPGQTLAVLGLAVCLVGILVTTFVQCWFGAGFNPFGFLALGVTIYALYVSLRILALQGEQGDDQEERYRKLFDEIRTLSAQAARSSDGAKRGVDHLIEQLRGAFAARPDVERPDLLEEVPELFSRLQAVRQALVLWVDDDPGMIEWERAALREGGVRSVWVSSTEEALRIIDENDFGVIVTDMGRLDNNRAGYDLLDALRESGVETPVLVYSSSDREEHRREVFNHRGQGATNSPFTILQLIAEQLAH